MTADPASRCVLLLRHGSACAGHGADSERELTRRGHRQAHGVGEYLAAQGPQPDETLVSTATRARQTFDGVRAELPGFDGAVRYEEELYRAGWEDVLTLLRARSGARRAVMVVGHNPAMSLLVQRLAGEGSEPGALDQVHEGLPSGTLCVLRTDLTHWDELDEGDLVLRTVVRG